MTIVSWNVNSLRNAEVSFINFLEKYQPDIVFLQELRATEDQLSFFLKLIEGYDFLINTSGRPGYSGTAVYYKKTLEVSDLTTQSEYELLVMEGRYISCKIGELELHNFYVPNGNANDERYRLKLAYHDEMLALAKKNSASKIDTIFMGDLNVCHTAKDLFNPAVSYSCFRPDETKWFDDMLDAGYLDSFRLFNDKDKQYTWWHLKDKTRSQNRGYRFDYFIVSKSLQSKIIRSDILKDVYGSDHCPILLEIAD